MEIVVLSAVAVIGMMYVYHLGQEHAKDIAAKDSEIELLKVEVAAMRKIVDRKNAYIKNIEAALLDGATADELAVLLTGMFPNKDKNGARTRELPGGGPTGEAHPGVHFGTRGKPD